MRDTSIIIPNIKSRIFTIKKKLQRKKVKITILFV